MHQQSQQKIWVVFRDQTERSGLQWLRPGFRHCYILLQDEFGWSSIDPLSIGTESKTSYHVPRDFDLVGWLTSRGQKVVPAMLQDKDFINLSFIKFRCVNLVKRILGISNPFIITPWQLYRFLTKGQQERLVYGDMVAA